MAGPKGLNRFYPDWADLYLLEDMTTYEIGEQYDCSAAAVSYGLKSIGVELRRGGVRSRPAEERFWEQVDRGDDDECWIFRSRGRHHSISIDDRLVGAHRFSFELANGSIPDGHYICHSCDTPSCVNPAHLFLGTPQDNAVDMYQKKRGVDKRGERHHNAKLTADGVRAIRRRCESGESQRAVARSLNLSQGAVNDIMTRRTWAHLE